MEQIARNEHQLSAVLQRTRKAKGLTQAQLGQNTQMRQATISSLEDGSPATRLSTVFAVLAAMDLELVVRPRRADGKAQLRQLMEADLDA